MKVKPVNLIGRNNPGFTLIEITIVVAIISVVSAIALPGLLKARIITNDAVAKTTLRTIRNSIMMYLIENSNYPTDESDLLSPASDPPYLERAYHNQTIRGYQYSYNFNNNYTVSANPEDCGRTGSKNFTMNLSDIYESSCE